MSGQVLGADVDLDAENDPGIDKDIDELRAVFLLLADCFVIHDRSTDQLTKTVVTISSR
jgi:hypothetical protein